MRYKIPLFLLLATVAAHAESDNSIPLGIEVVTAYRSESVYRGFRLSQDALEAQAQAQIALSNDWLLDVGAWHTEETGNGDFSDTAAFIDLTYDTDKWALSLRNSFHNWDGTFFEDGTDHGLLFTWKLNEDWKLSTGAYYDTGADAWYANVEAGWSRPTGVDSFISANVGTSILNDYYGRSGWNDLYGKLSWTYNFNKSVALTPFVGTSIGDEEQSLFGGLLFEVNF